MMTVSDRYLEVSYRNGKAFAAYLFLPRKSDDRSSHTERFSEILVIDYAEDGTEAAVECAKEKGVRIPMG